MATKGVVRPFAECDRSDVITLWEITFADDPPWNEPSSVIDTKLLIQPELFLVYEFDGIVVGTIIAGFDGFRGWIHHVAVHPSNQGMGISHKMIQAAELGLRQLGCRKINLQVRAENAQTVEKYAKMGFSEEQRTSMGKVLC